MEVVYQACLMLNICNHVLILMHTVSRLIVQQKYFWEVPHAQGVVLICLLLLYRVEAKAHKLDKYRKEAHRVREIEQDLSLQYPHGLPVRY